ncbi:MAG TPA: hypothetical protein VN541_20410 [Tepidisphaeraceae bacterium]|nr:hypothetical protein [Tepidisphaeraceae bacterium]
MPTAQRQWSIAPRRRGLLVILLAITNLATASLFAHTWFDGWIARDELYGFATYAGSMQAHADYCNGVLREYELSAGGHSDFTGRRDGPFQIWRWTYYPDLGRNNRFANQAFVQAYNSRMKFMQAHPDEWRADEMGGHNPEGDHRRGSESRGRRVSGGICRQ